MALAYSRNISFLLDTGFTVISATADDTHIYVLARSSSASRIYTLDKQGEVERYVSITHDTNGVGLIKNATAFGVLTKAQSGQFAVNTYSLSGALALQTPLYWKISPYPSGSQRMFGDIYGLEYDFTLNQFIAFLRPSPYAGTYRIMRFGLDGYETIELARPDGVAPGWAATTRSLRTYWYVIGVSTTIHTADVTFTQAGDPQPVGDAFTGTAIVALAHSQKQLIVISNDSKLFFYGDEPVPPPVGPQPVRQIYADTPAIERFDIVRPSPFTVIASNIEVERSTSLSLAGLEATGTLQERLKTSEITPIFTVPDAKTDDKMFTHQGDADTPPTEVPTNRPVYTINGILSVGNFYRQSFAVTEDTD